MTIRLPLVLGSNGLPQQLQSGDTLPPVTNWINLAAAFGLVADGNTATPTNNAAAIINMTIGMKAFVGGAGLIPQLSYKESVTFTPGTPGTVTTLIPHGLAVGAAVRFPFATSFGSSGISPSTTYYVAFANLTTTTFEITTTDPFANFTNGINTVPTPITIGSGASGVFMCRVNSEWINFWVPPGVYYSSTNAKFAGPPKFRLYASGAIFPGGCSFGFGSAGLINGGFFVPTGGFQGFPINTVTAGQSSMTVINHADAAQFPPNSVFMIASNNAQDTFGQRQSTPFNVSNYEFCRSRLNNTSTGVVSFGSPINGNVPEFAQRGYFAESPQVWPGDGTAPVSGPAMAYPMGPVYDSDIEVYGIRSASAFQSSFSAYSIKLFDVEASTQPIFPTQTKSVIFDNPTVGDVDAVQNQLVLDKEIEYFRLQNAARLGGLLVEGCGPKTVELVNVQVPYINGLGNKNTLKGCKISNVLFAGALSNGVCESLHLDSSEVVSIQRPSRIDQDSSQPSAFQNLASNFTFSGGVLTQPLLSKTGIFSNGYDWMIPGAAGFFTDFANRYDNMGSPFKILNVLPSQDATATVSITGADITWTGSPIANDDIVSFSGPLPSGGQLLTFTPYHAVQVGVAGVDKFKVSAIAGGTPITTTGGTTTPVAYKNANIKYYTTLTGNTLPTGISASHAATVANDGSGNAIFDWGVAAPANTTYAIVSVAKTADLPGGFSVTTLYQVIQSGTGGANKFKLATVGSSTPIAFTSAGTSVTVITNPLKLVPHPVLRVSGVNSGGCPAMDDICSGPQGVPWFSWSKRGYVGQQTNTGAPYSGAVLYAWGVIKQLTINVRTPDTNGGSPVLTVTASGFSQPTALALTTMTQTINLAVAGVRTIFPVASPTGAQSGDSLAAYPDWISGQINVSFSGLTGGQPVGSYAVVDISIETDQGVTATSTLVYQDPNFSNLGSIINTTWSGPGMNTGASP